MSGYQPDATLSVRRLWGVTPGKRVWMGGHNRDGKRIARMYLRGTLQPPSGPIDLAVVVPVSAEEAVYFADKLKARLSPEGAVWVIWPTAVGPDKEAASHLGRLMAQEGFHNESVVALSEVYQSICFRPGHTG